MRDTGRLLLALCCLALTPGTAHRAAADDRTAWDRATPADNDVLQWNAAAIEAVRQSKMGPPIVARALAILHTCMFDAWAAYDEEAEATRLGGRGRRPAAERSPENRRRAVNEAAYRAFVDLFPRHRWLAADQMTRAGLTPAQFARPDDPQAVGRMACSSVLAFRHHDGANQLGDENGGLPYSDYTRYRPVNTLTDLRNPSHWQPVSSANLGPTAFMVPHWGRVTPFAFRADGSTRPPAPPAFGSPEFTRQVDQLLAMSASLTDREKAIVEYWMDGPQSETPPGHWNKLAQQVSRRDGHTLDDDVRMFFVLNNALMDAAIAAWDCKRHFDYVRPMTAIRTIRAGQVVEAWAGPGKGPGRVDGARWLPFQRANFITPPFPEYVSGHSTLSAAAAEVLKRFTGDDAFGARYVVAKGSSRIEPGTTPREPVVLQWATFTDAAVEAGISRRYGGIHFESGDFEGQKLGRRVGAAAWRRAAKLFGERGYGSGGRSTE